MRRIAAGAAGLLVAASALVGAVGAAPPAQAQAVTDCTVKAGQQASDFWPQKRLNFQQVWSITRGAGVLVAVIDSGLNTTNPQMTHLKVATPGIDVIPGYRPTNVADCYGHGTAVTSIIAAQPSQVPGYGFLGVAPDATILPIKQTNTQGDKTGTAAGIAAAITKAADRGARVANVSVTVNDGSPQLLAAVKHAADKGMVIVTSAGNDTGQGTNEVLYPAAYATKYPNVIAVAATDQKDNIAQFSVTGSFVSVAAPGAGIETPAPGHGYIKVDGTSFATPYVTGTVALMLSAHRSMTPAEVRNRLEATADPPPASVPDAKYGYGIVDPFLAVTAVRNDDAAPPSPARARALPPPAAPHHSDRHLQHLALASAAILFGLAVLVATGAAVLRGNRSAARRSAATG